MTGKKVISIKDLEYIYKDGTHALHGVNLDIHEGESVALIGSNGAGKSTLVKHLIGVLWPSAGSIEVNGKKLDKSTVWDVRSTVSIVFQNPDDQIFCTTVDEDIAFGPVNLGCSEEEVQKRVASAVKKVGIEDISKKPAYHLSGGQKKKVAIATALSMNPEIIIMDEPTANLSPDSEEEFMKIINELPITKIIISHDIPILAQTCKRVILLDDGKVILDSSMDEFLKNKELMRKHGFDYSFKCECCHLID